MMRFLLRRPRGFLALSYVVSWCNNSLFSNNYITYVSEPIKSTLLNAF